MNVGKFGGSLFSNYAVSVTAELIGSLMCLLLDKTGRKPFHIGVLMGGSLACFLTLIPLILLDKCKIIIMTIANTFIFLFKNQNTYLIFEYCFIF